MVSNVLGVLQAVLFNGLMFLIFTAIGMAIEIEALKSIWETSLLAPKSPSRALALGLLFMCTVMPALAWLIAYVLQVPPDATVGLMLVSIMPGGLAGTLFSKICGANFNLNATMTVLSSLFAMISVPILSSLVVRHLVPDSLNVSYVHLVGTSFCIIVPLCLGIGLKRCYPHRAPSQATFQRLSIIVAIVICINLTIVAARSLTILRIASAFLLALSGLIVGIAFGFIRCCGFDVGRANGAALAFELLNRDTPFAMSIVLNSFETNVFRDGVQGMVIVYGMTAALTAALFSCTIFTLAKYGMISPLNAEDVGFLETKDKAQDEPNYQSVA